MLSAFIHSRLSYPAVLLAEQLVPPEVSPSRSFVLRTAPLKFPTPATNRDRTVSRRSEPSSRAALMGEHPTLGTYFSPGCDEPTSRCQTSPSMWTLGGDQPVYPRGSFYPLSDGPPTRYHRITKPDFRPCSTCGCRSQAPFCLCTLRTISDRSEGTFGRLRYFLGGDRPSQTAHLTMSCDQIHGRHVRISVLSGWYPKVDSPRLTPWFPRLPPILYRQYQNSMLSYSKALRGLYVQSRVASILTRTTTSPDLQLVNAQVITPFVRVRTYLTRNFATFRTVIVTAAVYWGLSSHLRLR